MSSYQTFGPLFEAVRKRDEILEDLEERNPSFNEIAPPQVLSYLKGKESATGEQIVDHLKAIGIKPEDGKDDRAFGPVFMTLSRRKQIVRIGFQPRKKGHAAPGASIWKIA